MRNALLAIGAALAVASALILAYGVSPLEVYQLMLARTWGDAYGTGQVLARTTPLIFTGLAVAAGLRAGLFNIGAEGQLVLGSFVTAVVAATLPLPPVIAPLVAILCGALAGGLAGGIAGGLKARFGAHEVITTIMLNFIIAALVLWIGREAFFEPETVHTPTVLADARIPYIPGTAGSTASFAIVIAVVVAVLVHVFYTRTRTGFELRALGGGTEAAATAGISVPRRQLLALALGGALAGMVGAQTVLGYKGYFEEGLGSGAGFMGIAVCLIARAHALAVVPAALLMGTLIQGGLAANALVPKEIVEVFQGVLILALAIASGRRPT